MSRAARALLACALLAPSGCGDNRTPPGAGPTAPGGAPALTCLPDLDGVLEAAELPILPGAEARYLVSPAGVPRAIDVEGSVDASGRRTWSLGTDFADDRVVGLGPAPLREQWFAAEFPEGDHVAPVDVDGAILGVYHLDERGLWLHGVASAEPDPPEGRTLLPYVAPVPIFRLPIDGADRWVVTGEVTEGTLLGLAYRGTDTYDSEVVGAGRLDLPDWSFGQAWRVDQSVTVTPAIGAPASRRITSWLFECFGEVARAEGAVGSTAEVTMAAELRRITTR